MSHTAHAARRRGFSLIELVIVVVIIGIIAAIAIPKMSRGAAGAGDSALQGNLAILRNAVELYNAEHGGFPGNTSGVTVTDQLTMFSNAAGATNATKTSVFAYGPYLRKVPQIPVGSKKGTAGADKIVTTDGVAAFTPGAGTEGWVYNSATGEIKANLADTETVSGSTTKYNEF